MQIQKMGAFFSSAAAPRVAKPVEADFSSGAAAPRVAAKPVEADLFAGVDDEAGVNDESDSPVRLTQNAIKRLQLLQKHGKPSTLRLTVNSGGCSGYQYDFELESEGDAREDDVVVEKDGAVFRMDPISVGFMEESEIDYVEEMIRASFQVSKNKQAEANCSCGHSFAPAAF